MLIDQRFEKEFKSISGLNWLPWVGNNYDKHKVLIVGDSHYDDGDGWLIYRDATRKFVNNQGLNSDNPLYRSRYFFNRIEKTVFNCDSISFEERKVFWNNTAFFNLVQRLMPTRHDRPTEVDFDLGWKVFLKIADILKPDVCIKMGYDGFGRLGYYLNNNDTIWSRDNTKEFFTRPLSVNLTNNGHRMRIIAIHHPTGSRGYSPQKWSNHILTNFPAALSLKD